MNKGSNPYSHTLHVMSLSAVSEKKRHGCEHVRMRTRTTMSRHQKCNVGWCGDVVLSNCDLLLCAQTYFAASCTWCMSFFACLCTLAIMRGATLLWNTVVSSDAKTLCKVPFCCLHQKALSNEHEYLQITRNFFLHEKIICIMHLIIAKLRVAVWVHTAGFHTFLCWIPHWTYDTSDDSIN